MLMRTPEYQVEDQVESKRGLDGPFVVHTPREMLLGQVVLILLLVIAILLRTMA